MAAYPTPTDDTFAPAREALDGLALKLANDALDMTHAEVEQLIDDEGTEVLRRLFQAHLDLRALNEERVAMVGEDGQVRGHRRKTSRGLSTLFGSVTVMRISLTARGISGGLRPLDAELNLPDDLYSFGVRRRLAMEAATKSYDATLTTVSTSTGARVPKRQAEEAVRAAARDFDAFYANREITPEPTTELLVLTFDGKGVPMLPDALRPATRKAAARDAKLKKRRSPGEKPRKRMAQVAAVYSLPVSPRTPDDIVGEYRPKGPRRSRPRARNKRVWASVEKEPAEVIEEAFHAALLRDESLQRRWVVLVDGNPTQIRLVREAAAAVGTEVTLVLDLVHVLEYVWKAAWCLFDTGDPAAEDWVTERLLRLLRGEASAVAAGIRRSATMRGLPRKKRAPIDKCADYLLKYKHMLRYDDYLRDGLPIATGVIEGACRYLVKDRMEITGARWSLDGAEAVLRLRAIFASGDFDEYWAFHQRQERERNHLVHYAATEFTDLRGAA